MTNASQEQVPTKELSLLTVQAAWIVTNTTHSACEGWALWRICVNSLMVPFTLSHPGLNPCAPCPAGRIHPVMIQYDFIYFKSLSQCYQGTHCPRHCLHDWRQKWIPGDSLGTRILRALPGLGLPFGKHFYTPRQRPLHRCQSMSKHSHGVARNLKCSVLFSMAGSFLSRTFQAAHMNNSSRSTFAHPFLAMSLSQRLQWESNREPLCPACFSKIVSEQNQAVLLRITARFHSESSVRPG